MRTIIPHTATTRIAAAVLAGLCVLSLFKAATARDDLGLHLFWSEQVHAEAPDDRAAVPPLPLRSARAVRPLRIALMTRRRRHVARRRQHGIHIFRGDVAGQHRPRDFVRLQVAASLGWKLRQTLNNLDRNPPTRWTSLMATPS